MLQELQAYLWQVSTSGGTYTPLTNGSPYLGVNTATLNINPAAIGLTGYKYECILSNAANSATTTTATLTVNGLPTVNATLNVSVINATLGLSTYQWYSGSGKLSGATTDSYSPNVTGNYFVVVTNNTNCSNTSNSVSFTAPPSTLKITSLTATNDTICTLQVQPH